MAYSDLTKVSEIYEVASGASPETVVRELIAAANAGHCSTIATFNDVHIAVDPGDNFEVVVAHVLEELRLNRKAYEAIARGGG